MVTTARGSIRKYVLAFAAGATIVGAVVAVSGFSAATSASDTPDSTGFLTSEKVQQATDQSESAFPEPLPAGIAWPQALPATMTAKGARVDPGVPRATTSFYWLCAWEDAYMKAVKGGDANSASTALATAARFRELPFFQEDYVDPDGLWYTNVIEAALNGNTSGVEADLAQCTYFYESQP